MARRRIDQEELRRRPEPRSGASLQQLAALIDWAEVERHLIGISASVTFPPDRDPGVMRELASLEGGRDLQEAS
jgi:hypothetical protein